MPAVTDNAGSKEDFDKLLGALNSPEFKLNVITE